MRPHTWFRARHRNRRAVMEWLRKARRKGGMDLWSAVLGSNIPHPSPSGWGCGMRRSRIRMWKYEDPLLAALKAEAAKNPQPGGRQMFISLETGKVVQE